MVEGEEERRRDGEEEEDRIRDGEKERRRQGVRVTSPPPKGELDSR